MIVCISEPLFLGGLVWWDKIRQCDFLIFLDDVPFWENGFQHRNKIRTKDSWQWLTIPIMKKGHRDQLLIDTRIDMTQMWRDRMLGRIRQSYHKAANFDVVFKWFADMLDFYGRNYLVMLTETMTHDLLIMMGMQIKMVSSYHLMQQYGGEPPKTISEKLAILCDLVDGHEFIAGATSMKFLDKAEFEKKRIDVRAQEFKHPAYPQAHDGFIEGMGILDVLLNHGDKSKHILGWSNESLYGKEST